MQLSHASILSHPGSLIYLYYNLYAVSLLSLVYSNRSDGSLPKLVHLRLRHKLVSLGN